jgi:serine/threonine-protein kinase
MGEVWRASHRMLARPAAIKLIREQAIDVVAGETAGTLLRRFEREAQATAALTSPHTVQIYDFGITREGTFYYVMELLHGLDLRTLVEKTGPVPPQRTLHLLRQACDSLADAHAHGMVHRDVKPANLFVCRQGLTFDFLKVLDFGLVRESGDAHAQLTQQGMTSGTPGYMAPEVATEKRRIDGRADLYALGCVGYWLLTGSNVFTADSALALVLKHVNEPPPPMRQASELDIPEEVESLIMECLAKSPNDRPESAQQLAARLDAMQKLIGPWTAEQAEAWWRLHLADLVQVAQPTRPTSFPVEQETE